MRLKKRKLESLLNLNGDFHNSDNEIVAIGSPEKRIGYPVLFYPKVSDVSLVSWMHSNMDLIEDNLKNNGAILFRGFNCSKNQFNTISEYFGEKLSYEQRSSPRSEVGDRIYTSTDHPCDQKINMHTENSYSASWPMKLLFYCDLEPSVGGETPLASTRLVLDQIPSKIIDTFREKGILYQRSFGSEVGLSWQEVFQTKNYQLVEEDCVRKNINYTWSKGHERLTIKWKRPAIVRHPLTKDEVWFNHAYFFHASTLDHRFRKLLEEEYLPFNTFYGDGTEIENETIKTIADIYEQNSLCFQWKKGDLLLVDNMLTAHGRNPFKGERRILVSMSESQSVNY